MKPKSLSIVDYAKRVEFVKSSLAILVFTAAGAAAQPLSPKPTLHTPDVIAPAVLPYLACLYAERGLPLLRATDGTQVTYDKSASGCSAARGHATTAATKLLQGKPVPGGQSASAFIEQTLDDMDGYVASLPRAHAQSAVIGIPVTIEDEVQPAYARYDDCLKTQMNNSEVSPDTIIAKFREAMTTCASVRDYAVSEAAKALAGRGWDEATRTRAAETTFDKVDESWLAMGQQYRDLLLQNAARAVKPAVPDAKRK